MHLFHYYLLSDELNFEETAKLVSGNVNKLGSTGPVPYLFGPRKFKFNRDQPQAYVRLVLARKPGG
jgi:hypothetical protein